MNGHNGYIRWTTSAVPRCAADSVTIFATRADAQEVMDSIRLQHKAKGWKSTVRLVERTVQVANAKLPVFAVTISVATNERIDAELASEAHRDALAQEAEEMRLHNERLDAERQYAEDQDIEEAREAALKASDGYRDSFDLAKEAK